jgi:hypothetical protein
MDVATLLRHQVAAAVMLHRRVLAVIAFLGSK